MAQITTPGGGDASGKVDDAKVQAQEKAQEAKAKASDQVRAQVDERSTQAGEQIATQATDIRTVGEELRKQGKDGPAKVADQAAERAERLGSYLKDKDADTILSDVEDLARKQPLAVIAGGIALGFAASRFLKASSSQRYDQRRSSGSGMGDLAVGQPQLPRRTPAGSPDPLRTGSPSAATVDAPPLPPVAPGTAPPVGTV